MRPQYNVFTRKLIFVSIMPQRGERAHGSLWQEAGGFYCYVWLETVGVLKKGKPGNGAIKTTRSVKNVRGVREFCGTKPVVFNALFEWDLLVLLLFLVLLF